MGNWIAWWARGRVAANLLMIGIIVSGLLAFLAMEREVWPTIRINWVEVIVPWPGAAPQEVEEQIIIRIEEALADLDDVIRIRATARENTGLMYIEANPKVDIVQFLNDVKLRIDGISTFPRDIEPPRVRVYVTRNELIRVAVHGEVDERILKRTAEKMRDEVALLPGAAIVELFGDRKEEVSVELSEIAMRRYGVTFDEVARAIRGSSINRSAGTVRTDTGDIMLRARNLADTREEFGRIIIRQTADGAMIRVSDIANIVDGFEDVDILATLNGEPAILVQVMTSENMNVVKTSEAVKKWVEEASERVPDGVGLTLWWDNSEVYFNRMETIVKSGLYGLCLVFLVLILSLRPKVALWVTAGIATAYLGAFIALPANDVSLNMLSTFAFLLVLGVVVDDAIIIGESIHRESMATGGGVDAAIVGTQLVAKPVIFAVLTTMIAFVPWMFLSGASVQITRHITIIIIAALSFSLIEAFLILPAHLSKMHPREGMGRFGRFQKRIADGIIHLAEKRYRPFVAAAVRRRYLTASIFLFFLIVSVGVTSSGWLKFSFMPEIENEMISVNVTMPDGAPYSRALEILDQLQLAQQKLEAEVNERAGDGEGVLIENWYTRSRKDSVLALVQLAPPEKRQMSAKEAADRLRELIGDIPDAEEIKIGFTIDDQDPGLQYSIKADSFDDLRMAADALKDKLRTY
ncbi:MAG: efflux RND transporter permease subunit, partial [Sphingomonadales bacterium]